jgi:hypothetical protein
MHLQHLPEQLDFVTPLFEEGRTNHAKKNVNTHDRSNILPADAQLAFAFISLR